MNDGSPLIVTLLLDEVSSGFFNDKRKKYFPSQRNYLPAHLTLFHHLPSNEPTLTEDLEAWSSEQSLLPLQVSEVKSIGKGVAYKIDCPDLLLLHKQMQTRWSRWLNPQDKQGLWPHVTVQNKVSATEAKQTLQILQESFQPFTATGTGFGLWAYKGGPWQFLQRFPFAQL